MLVLNIQHQLGCTQCPNLFTYIILPWMVYNLQFTRTNCQPMLFHFYTPFVVVVISKCSRCNNILIFGCFYFVSYVTEVKRNSIPQCIVYRNFWLKFIMTADTDFNINLWKEIPQFSLRRPRDLLKKHLTKLTTLWGDREMKMEFTLIFSIPFSYSTWTTNRANRTPWYKITSLQICRLIFVDGIPKANDNNHIFNFISIFSIFCAQCMQRQPQRQLHHTEI